MCSLVLCTCSSFSLSGRFIPQNGPCNLATGGLALPCTLTCSSSKKDLYLCGRTVDVAFTGRFSSLCRRPCVESFSCESCSPKNQPSFSFTHCRFPSHLAARRCLAVAPPWSWSTSAPRTGTPVLRPWSATWPQMHNLGRPKLHLWSPGTPRHCVFMTTLCHRPWCVSHSKIS
jgi:hypothetical protein